MKEAVFMKHYVCKHCGNLVAMVNDTGRNIGCCGENMREITPSAISEVKEKHTPRVEKCGDTVKITVGSEDALHPMLPNHAIAWVCLVTTEGSQRKKLKPDGHAVAEFRLCKGDEPIKAFAYCNVHGLWVTECKC